MTSPSRILTTKRILPARRAVPPSQLAISGCYLHLPTGPYGTWGLGGTQTQQHFLNNGNVMRIRQNTVIYQIALVTVSLTNLTHYYFEIWRGSASNCTMIYQEDILPKLTANQACTVKLAQPVQVLEGDFVGYGWVASSAPGAYQGWVDSGADSNETYWLNGYPSTTTGYNWTAQGESARQMPIICYGIAPVISCIGDSLIEGRAQNRSFIADYTISNPPNSIPYWIGQILGWSYQNMGGGGQTSAQILARFASDVVNQRPTFALIEGGINDIGMGGVTQSQYIANMTAMLNQCSAAGIVPIVLTIFPATQFSNTNSAVTDSWNAALASLVSTYPQAILVDVGPWIGVYRSGGASGNLWDDNPLYLDDSDGLNVHLNEAGYIQVAMAIAIAVQNAMAA